MTHTETIVNVTGVRTVNIVEELNLSVRKNEIHALMGPVGAGKSTIIKILSGMLYPTQGHVNVMGCSPWEEPEKYAAKIGVVLGQKSRLMGKHTAMRAFTRCKEMFKVNEARYRENLDYLVNNLEIETVIKKPVSRLTPGETLRCDLARALLHDPQLVFLDEPEADVDTVSRETVRRLIKKVNRERNVTFIITTRDLAEIKHLCDTVSVIHHGRIVYNDRIDNLKMYHSQANMIEVIISETPARSGYLRPCTGDAELLRNHIFRQHSYN
jgi:ABC-2 type transport system ATP-binding protein